MPNQKYNFRANVGLKDILGQGLINNSNIAIIELIKNAKDAGSKSVELIFRNAVSGGPNSMIIIQDSGMGMNLDDVSGKWLNIAFSEKKAGSETRQMYYAGEKGIGRFSCDRLGKKLDLFSRKTGFDWAHLVVNWHDFEIYDPNILISDIKLDLNNISAPQVLGAPEVTDRNHGTTLVISDIRESWGEPELKRLKKELERFIIDPKGEFAIHLKSYDLVSKDGALVFDHQIENKLLSRIDEKTISIFSSISIDGKMIKNEIHHFGDVILSYEWDNPYSHLKNISAQIHYLSQESKVSFKAITGYTSTDYGSVMLFLNGFRVMPYGEPKDDWLQLNERKNQGNSRHLGTRELFGLVEIQDNSHIFEPVSSREGLAHNMAFGQLSDDETFPGRSNYSYLKTLIRTLEKYVVEGMDWDRIAPENHNFSYEDILAAVNSIVKSTSKGTTFRNIHIDEQKLRQIAKKKVVQVREFVADLIERVSNKNVYELTKSDQRDLKRYVVRHEEALAARSEVANTFKQQAEVETKRRLFAESQLTNDAKRIADMQHLVGLWGEKIEKKLSVAMRNLGQPDLDVLAVQNQLEVCYLLIKKLNKLSAIITRADFNLVSDGIVHDVFSYIEEYISEIRQLNVEIGTQVLVTYRNDDGTALTLNFSPLEVSMLIDNAISNSIKGKAKRVNAVAYSDRSYHYLDIQDDGTPLSDKYAPDQLFEYGVTTTKGSGIGLRHIKDIAERLDASVSIFSNDIGGTTLRIRWGK